MTSLPRFSPTIDRLLDLEIGMPLGPGTPHEEGVLLLRGMTADTLLEGKPIADIVAASACMAGLWLRVNDLDRSHQISQELATTEGSFWHAIMHRREPDAWNSKYWWRRVGAHPVLTSLAEKAPALGYRFTDAAAFVDFVEKSRSTDSPDEHLALRVQLLEWQLLFDFCFNLAVGGNSR